MVEKAGQKDVAGGNYLRRLRLAEGLSPEQLGGLTSVAGGTIRRAEEKGRIPHPHTQLKLARHFDKHPWDIWTVRRTITSRETANVR